MKVSVSTACLLVFVGLVSAQSGPSNIFESSIYELINFEKTLSVLSRLTYQRVQEIITSVAEFKDAKTKIDGIFSVCNFLTRSIINDLAESDEAQSCAAANNIIGAVESQLRDATYNAYPIALELLNSGLTAEDILDQIYKATVDCLPEFGSDVRCDSESVQFVQTVAVLVDDGYVAVDKVLSDFLALAAEGKQKLNDC